MAVDDESLSPFRMGADFIYQRERHEMVLDNEDDCGGGGVGDDDDD